MAGLPTQLVLAFDPRGPVGDQRGSDAALMVVMFVATERRVLEERPALAAEPVRVRFRRVAFGAPARPRLGVAAVVAEEQDQGVVQFAAFLEPRDERADGMVHAGDRRRVDRHQVVEAVFLGVRQGSPGLDRFGAGRQRPGRVDEPHLHLAGVTLDAQGSPAREVLAAELRDLVRRRLQREVRGVVGEVEEEGFLGGPGLIDELEPVAGPEVGGIPLLRQARVVVGDRLPVEEQLRTGRARLVEAAGRRVQAAVEAAVTWRDALFLTDVPLAGHRGEVAGRLERFRDRRAPVVEVALVAG